MRRWMAAGMSLVFTTALMAGCLGKSSDKGEAVLGTGSKLKDMVKPLGENEQASLVVYGNYMDERTFIGNYGNSYLVKFPNIDFTFERRPAPNGQPDPTKDPIDELVNLIDEKKPDVLMLSTQELEKLAKKGVLYELDPLVKQDNFDLQNIHAAAVETIRNKGGGKLYGLSPVFASSALFYNKDLFDKYNVPYPKDRMTWSEVIQLAQRFPANGSGEDRVYGLQVNGNLGSWVRQMASYEGLMDVDVEGVKLATADDNHKKLWNMAYDAYKRGVIDLLQDNSQYVPLRTTNLSASADPFMAGKAAMALKWSYDMWYLPLLKDSNLKPFDWQMVTAPVDPQNPGETQAYTINFVFAINAKSPNVRAAWQVIKYWNSEEYASYYTKMGGTAFSSFRFLVSRAMFNKPVDGRSLEPFYMLKPSKRDLGYGYGPKVPLPFGAAYLPIVNEEAKAIESGAKSVDEGLRSMQERGQKELDRIIAEEKAKQSAPPAR